MSAYIAFVDNVFIPTAWACNPEYGRERLSSMIEFMVNVHHTAPPQVSALYPYINFKLELTPIGHLWITKMVDGREMIEFLTDEDNRIRLSGYAAGSSLKRLRESDEEDLGRRTRTRQDEEIIDVVNVHESDEETIVLSDEETIFGSDEEMDEEWITLDQPFGAIQEEPLNLATVHHSGISLVEAVLAPYQPARVSMIFQYPSFFPFIGYCLLTNKSFIMFTDGRICGAKTWGGYTSIMAVPTHSVRAGDDYRRSDSRVMCAWESLNGNSTSWRVVADSGWGILVPQPRRF